jgi:hypothetical protein
MWCFTRLSKLLNQEDALSVPCLCVDFCPPRARPRGPREYCRHGHITVCYTRVITRTTADAFPVVGGNARATTHRGKAKQGRRGKTALTCGSYSHSSTVLERRRERERNSLVTMPALFIHPTASALRAQETSSPITPLRALPRSVSEYSTHRLSAFANERWTIPSR